MNTIVRCRLVLESDQLVLHVAADQWVERRERFVEEQHRRVDRQRPGQTDPLLHATRELLGVVELVPLQPDQLEHPHRLGVALGLGDPLHLQAVAGVVDHRAVWEQTEVLEHHRQLLAADLAQGVLVHRREVVIVERDLTFGDVGQAGDASHERRLPRARQTHHHERLAETDVERHVA